SEGRRAVQPRSDGRRLHAGIRAGPVWRAHRVTERFDVGVNYWPASTAMRWWRLFDAGEVDRDFARIRGAGGDLVRFFLLWEDFQPQPASVNDRCLELLVIVANTAQRHGLRVIPTLFTGHMSGANFV